MRIHTNTLTASDIYAAANKAGAVVATFSGHGSRSRARAFDVKLEGSSRRRPNGGASGAGTGYAATWDQWGMFLAELFAKDGSMFTPYDKSAEYFADRTADRFGAPEVTMTADGYRDVFVAYGAPDDMHGDHTFRYSGTPRQQECTRCTAVQRY